MATLLAILKAVSAAWTVWKSEREIYNRPDMVRGRVQEQQQQLRDRLNKWDAILSDPNATPQDHAEALRQLRLSDS